MAFIINADDLGQSQTINRAIREYAERNLISSATILANGPCFDEVRSIAQNYPNISFGVHLNITQFEALTSLNDLKEYGIVDGGNTLKRFATWGNFRWNSRIRAAIHGEWAAQIERLLDNKIRISHIDGHQHKHLLKELFVVLKRLQMKYRIRRVRVVSRGPLAAKIDKAFLSNRIHYYMLKYIYRTKTPAIFSTYLDMYNLLKGGHKLPANRVIELMTHPGGTSLPYFREENELMEQSSIPKVVAGFKLISYWDL
ncbi:MAG: ChbG/HpnK family deacetylase [Acidobacteria bacterium]|nr:ChbG/HpnK family deacetylase [Acidobacteriota bacterium]